MNSMYMSTGELISELVFRGGTIEMSPDADRDGYVAVKVTTEKGVFGVSQPIEMFNFCGLDHTLRRFLDKHQ
jgi:hypothetical protein